MHAGRSRPSILALLAVVALSAAAQARVTRVVVEDRKSPAFDGRSFGAAVRAVGQRLVGERLLLPEDAERIVRQAEDSGILKP